MDYGRESWWLRLSNDYFQLTRKCEEKKREKERERERERELDFVRIWNKPKKNATSDLRER